MMKKIKKRLTALMLCAMIAVTGFGTASAAKTVSGNGWTWKYGASAIGNGHYSKYYKNSGMHSAKVSYSCGKSAKGCSYGDDFPGDNGWANATKTCNSLHSDRITYSRKNSF